MNHTSNNQVLLPSGLFDLIGEEAEAEGALVQTLLGHFRGCGYTQVQPPLMEFTNTLIQGDEDSELAKRSFRLTDPVSQQMMAIRADMTMQIARIASSQLSDAPRPLRLCYAGQTLRTLPDSMRQTRQFRQIGIELFGSDALLADVEIMQIALSGLSALGIGSLSIDLSTPQLLPILLADIDADKHTDLLQAITHKDAKRIESLGGSLIASLCSISEPAEPALAKIQQLNLPNETDPIVLSLTKACDQLNKRLANKAPAITIDPLEMRGFGYHNGLSFSIYSNAINRELGRGGRYITPSGEHATGFTLYAEDITSLIDKPATLKPLLIPSDMDEATAQSWRDKGYQTSYALNEDLMQEAKSQGYAAFINQDGKLTEC